MNVNQRLRTGISEPANIVSLDPPSGEGSEVLRQAESFLGNGQRAIDRALSDSPEDFLLANRQGGGQ